MKDKRSFDKPSLTKALMIAVSLLGALLLWIYVTSTEKDDYTATFSGVKVVYDGEATMRESRGLVLTDRGVTTVKVSITGDRRTISKLDEADLTAVIDLSTISSTGRYTNSSYKITYPSGTDSSTLQVTSKLPEYITFVVDKLSTKVVEVKGVFSGSVADGFSVEPLEIEPASIKLYGPQNALEKVDSAWVEVSRQDVDKTLTFDSSYVLKDSEGNVIDDDSIEPEVDTVSVTLPITAVKDVTLGVKIIDGGGATVNDTKITIDPPTIQLSGDASVLDGVNTIDLATIDLADLVNGSFTETYDIVIPNDTEITSGSRKATVTVKIVGLETKTVSVSNFSCTNVTAGYEAVVWTENLSVTLRGPKDVLDSISDVNVRAVADLTDYGATAGMLSVPVEIVIDGTTEAGALGDYSVFVEMRAKEG